MTKAKLDYEVPAYLKREFVFQTAGILPPNGLFSGITAIRKIGEQAQKLGGKQILLDADATMLEQG